MAPLPIGDGSGSTIGRRDYTFADSLTQITSGASAPTKTSGGSNPVQVGLGVQVNATRNEMSEGAFQTTNNPLDIAIEGPGFLRVGETALKRHVLHFAEVLQREGSVHVFRRSITKASDRCGLPGTALAWSG